jgi:predicted flap endonuclease-1-like 5' DNA nuclease
MLAISKLLCRLWRCTAAGAGRQPPEEPTDRTEPAASDDLTVIRGIGIATQDRLYRSGIRSFAQLAGSTPDKVREVLGNLARGAQVEAWIAEAAGLAKAK